MLKNHITALFCAPSNCCYILNEVTFVLRYFSEEYEDSWNEQIV